MHVFPMKVKNKERQRLFTLPICVYVCTRMSAFINTTHEKSVYVHGNASLIFFFVKTNKLVILENI